MTPGFPKIKSTWFEVNQTLSTPSVAAIMDPWGWLLRVFFGICFWGNPMMMMMMMMEPVMLYVYIYIYVISIFSVNQSIMSSAVSIEGRIS